MKLVLKRGDHPHQLVAMLQQLAQVALLRRRNPQAREAMRAQQLQQVLGIASVGLLPSHRTSPDLGRVAHPQLIVQLRHQPLEPWRITRGLNPHQRRSRQTGVESSGFTVFVLQAARHHLAALRVQPCNYLVARMQITSDNQHGFGSSPRPALVGTNQAYRCEGADAVISSLSSPAFFRRWTAQLKNPHD